MTTALERAKAIVTREYGLIEGPRFYRLVSAIARQLDSGAAFAKARPLRLLLNGGRLVIKSLVKEHQRIDPRTGKVETVGPYTDKRIARAKLTLGRRRGAKQNTPAAAKRGGDGGHRFATIHTAGPDSPGHTVRLTPHPEKSGTWSPHPDDMPQVRRALGASAAAQRPTAKRAKTCPPDCTPAPIDELCKKYGGCNQFAPVGAEKGSGSTLNVVKAPVPKNLEALRRDVVAARQKIADILGDVGDTEDPKFANHAESADEVLQDAQAAEPLLRSVVGASAQAAGGEANFGPGGKFALKSPESLQRKVRERIETRQQGEAAVVKGISDAVRGSVLVDTHEQLKKASEAIRAAVEKAGGKIFVDNKFKTPHEFGYGAVHADLLLPAGDSGRMIRAEVQLHLRAVNDGTMQSVKESSHKFYELLRGDAKTVWRDAAACTGASLLAYMSAYAPIIGGATGGA